MSIIVLLSLALFSGLWVMCSKYEHLLSVLLSLEYVILSLFFISLVVFFGWEFFFSLIFITFTACEGALGLSVLIIMSRTHAGDYFKRFNLFKS